MSKNNTKTLKVYESDLTEMRSSCKLLYITHHPEDRGKILSDAFMFKKVVEFYVKA